jgi:Rps23 Pro-64 3,4-dihydroxylase Tpa1-like proline 4-hydroxylase
MSIRAYDRDQLRSQYRAAQPFPHVCIDDFLDLEFAKTVAAAYPSFEEAERLGFKFNFVNEQRKVQVTDVSKFPPPVKELHDLLASPAFLDDLSYITGIPKLLADSELIGGGMHVTGAGGRLDVHVDFNYVEERQLHRRLNVLVYLNPVWEPEWAGNIELWDRDVKHRAHAFTPKLGRCVLFETSEISYHGVAPLKCPPEVSRFSFATYYYTREAPPTWTGRTHSTVFRARPDEKLRGLLLMPAEKVKREWRHRLGQARRQLKNWIVR